MKFDESRMPTSGRPAFRACCAEDSAGPRPSLTGVDLRTTVNPSVPGGQNWIVPVVVVVGMLVAAAQHAAEGPRARARAERVGVTGGELPEGVVGAVAGWMVVFKPASLATLATAVPML